MPHYHIVLRSGHDLWTYERHRYATRSVRHQAQTLSDQGHRPIILTCRSPTVCRIYGSGSLTLEAIKRNIDRERHQGNAYTPTPTPAQE